CVHSVIKGRSFFWFITSSDNAVMTENTAFCYIFFCQYIIAREKSGLGVKSASCSSIEIPRIAYMRRVSAVAAASRSGMLFPLHTQAVPSAPAYG
ncbi:MAG TPA: hypothetical protein VFC39_03845, partial [Acidobacteriaceae bacterium]|nr:hypothetical protein [Acidobacteriaceae bacterium]